MTDQTQPATSALDDFDIVEWCEANRSRDDLDPWLVEHLNNQSN